MSTIPRAALLAAFAFGGFAPAADLASVDRTIKKEPTYQTKSPRYALLVFGPEARDRVWLVHDGDTLYVDRNGDGDLTAPEKKVTAKSGGNDTSYRFDAGELRIGGRVHKGLSLWTSPISQSLDEVKNRPIVKAHLAADGSAHYYEMVIELEKPGIKGLGAGGRVYFLVRKMEGTDPLLFSAKPTDAPVIHFDGPLQIRFDGETPTLKLDRDNDVRLAVGTPGHGPGTFAALVYEDIIPARVNPRIEATFAAAKQGEPAVRQSFVLKLRC
jgi:hypothetical protein